MSELVTAARRYIGKRFRHMGRGPYAYDCAGLILRALEDCGATVQDMRRYTREAIPGALAEAARRTCGEPVSKATMQPGDIVLMDGPGWAHAAIIGDHAQGGLSLIHAHLTFKRVTEHRLSDDWARKITGVYRWVR